MSKLANVIKLTQNFVVEFHKNPIPNIILHSWNIKSMFIVFELFNWDAPSSSAVLWLSISINWMYMADYLWLIHFCVLSCGFRTMAQSMYLQHFTYIFVLSKSIPPYECTLNNTRSNGVAGFAGEYGYHINE